MSDIDRIDYEIICALRNNARISNKELAEKISLAPSSCLERVRYLRIRGFIKGAHEGVNFTALGLGLQAMVAIRLNQHSRSELQTFQAHLAALPQVLTTYHLSGANDFLLHIAAHDAEGLRDFILNALTERSEVAHIETAVIYEETKNWTLPTLDSLP